MSFIENCVTTSWSAPFCCSGTTLISGSAPITTPAAWIESARVRPSSGCGELEDLLRDGIGVDRLAQLAARLQASSSVWPGPSGISFAILSTTP